MVYKLNDIIKCKVTKIESYGFYVVTLNNTEGLVHISQISNYFIKDIKSYVSNEEVIYARVIEVGDEDIKLSIKGINYKTAKGTEFQILDEGFLSIKNNLFNMIEERLNYKKEDN